MFTRVTLCSAVNNFVDWQQSGAVMRYSGYVEPQDGALSVLVLSQPELVARVRCIQKESHCERQLSAIGGNPECRCFSNGKTLISAKN